MDQARNDTLKVPEAALHYEVIGEGPVLLLIPGGPADSGAFVSIRGVLSDRYTVVTTWTSFSGTCSSRWVSTRLTSSCSVRDR